MFFFFQAEDGIRDIGVTGVQTCALPIWALWWTPSSSRSTSAPRRTASCRASAPLPRAAGWGGGCSGSWRRRGEKGRAGGWGRGVKFGGRGLLKKKKKSTTQALVIYCLEH